MPIVRLFRKIKKRIILKMAIAIHEAGASVSKITLPRFGNNPKNLTIDLPRRIKNPERIFFGDNVSLGPNTFINAITHYPTSWMLHPTKQAQLQRFNPKIIIGSNVTSTDSLQISAASKIVIEDDVMFASNIHINDSFHGYKNANKAYKYQELFQIEPILIKEGCWIGQNVVILSGVTIGKFCIVGSNSVVTNSIPDQCIAIGSPAKVIKVWNQTSQEWVSP